VEARQRREIVGRGGELEQVAAAFSAGSAVRGIVGIGKTTVWLAALELAEPAGYRALRCRPAEAEQALPFAALGDLLEPALDAAYDDLTDAQREALDVALQRVPAGEPATWTRRPRKCSRSRSAGSTTSRSGC
jgi:hypothetical protein